jgi:hypothetical protein
MARSPYTSEMNPKVTVENLPENVGFREIHDSCPYEMIGLYRGRVGYENSDGFEIYIYKDGQVFTDQYCYGKDRVEKRVTPGETVTLTYSEVGIGVKIIYKK